MKVVDARSGRELRVGDRVDYGGGEWLTLRSVHPGILKARATIHRRYRDLSRARLVPGTERSSPILDLDTGAAYPSTTVQVVDVASAPFVEDVLELPLHVRWTHPKYLMQHVAFIPS